MQTFWQRMAVCGAGMMLAGAVQAQVTVSDAWVRATVPGQKSTGAFMTLQAAQDAKLVGAKSDVAAATEVHEMKMEGDIMRMREVDSVTLPAGHAVELKPGGYHIMLLDVKQQMKAGDHVELTLETEDANGKRHSQQVQAEVRPLTAAGGGGGGHGGHGGHGH